MVTAGGRRLIFDAGTGIRALSRRLRDEGRLDAHLFVTHYHWDHIQGFPFLAQLYEPETRLCVHGPREGDIAIDRAFAGQMAPIYFPIPLDAIAARVDFTTANGTPWYDGGVQVSAFRVRHPGYTCGYRVTVDGATAVYVPDCELGDADPAWYAAMVEFARGADLLLHDAMFTEAEYERYRGWGHSTFGQALKLAEDAGVARLAFFHHAPDRGDAELGDVVAAARREVEARGSALHVSAAAEGEEIALAGRAA